MNTRLVKNKIMKVKDFVVDHDIDILAITETWLRPGNIDEVDIGTLCPTGYRFFHVPRSYSLGGGVGLLFKETINVNSQITDTFESFEYMDARPRCLQGIRILVIYRPPGRSSYDLFYEEFSKLIEQTAVTPGGLLIVGDFNLHVDDGDDFQARRFVDILESYNLKQYVTGATHISGHTLDLVITKSNDASLHSCPILSNRVHPTKQHSICCRSENCISLAISGQSAVDSIDSFDLSNGKVYYRFDKCGRRSDNCISLVTMATRCKIVVESTDSFDWWEWLFHSRFRM